ncbi:MAG: hypothetical protein IKB02_00820 [Clostridia bacterium]|nr:hypothetical protein [Clostridia bacterium]
MIYDNIKIAVLGGDRRQLYAIMRLAETGAKISVTGLDIGLCQGLRQTKITRETSPAETLKDASVIILPFPVSADGAHINAPLDKDGELGETKLLSVLRLSEPGALIIGGKLPEHFASMARDKGHSVHDLLAVESLEIKNAYITAEAALSVAMNTLSHTISGASIGIAGFGRISKQLSRLFSALGAKVTVAARKDSDLAFAETLGYKTVKIEGEHWSEPLTCGYDMIFNTVPHMIFNKEFLEKVDKSTVLVELASVPGGFDLAAVHELSSNISWAPSLPGKYAPESAGELIADSIIKIISREARQL